ncbi:MAG TPA: trigger factor [Candidatus Magasanikbacteria bacterium]|jgi:trigger factor|nr:trigger factor [Candidatus Magasanikbacteria bacterium]HQF57332.1 trigger factor [Candidatus Magasanikbacteria bacterium]
MSYTTKKLEKSQIEFTITVKPQDYEKHLKKAAQRISTRTKIKGFRPGKASYEIVKKEVGAMNILNEALEQIVQESFYQAVKKENLDTIGMPKIKIDKIVPDNDLVYQAIVALLPKVKLPDISKIKVEKKVKPVEEKHIDEVIENLRKMQAKEIIKNDKKTTAEDKLIIDMDMFLDNVPIDGGQAKDYQVYLSEPHYIPGFDKQLIGLSKDEEKEFELNFPKNHYQKHLAGKNVKFKIKVKDIYERQLPELSDELAKNLGQESLAKLRELINSNLIKEAEDKANQKAEIEILDAIIEKTNFEEIPDVLIDAEKEKMFYELKKDLERNGIAIEQYLSDIKKKEKELFDDFKDQAEKRAKAALISRQTAIEQNIHIHDEEIDKEIKMMEQMYKEHPDFLENLRKPEVRDTIAMTMQNRKVIQWFRHKILGEPLAEDVIHKHDDEHKQKEK